MNLVKPWTDWLGVTASVACAIHCAAMPFVIAFLPAFGLSFLADEGFHQVMVFVCLLFAAAAFVPGWRRHRHWLPAGIALIGLALIATSAFALEGRCCAECADSSLTLEAAPNVVAASNVLAASSEVAASNVLAASNAEACTAECCEHCSVSSGTMVASTAEESETRGVAAAKVEAVASHSGTASFEAMAVSLIPWITPLGGLLLVSAHLTNLRFSCRCGCCPTSGESEVIG